MKGKWFKNKNHGNKNFDNLKKSRINKTCYNRDKKGHFIYECKHKKKETNMITSLILTMQCGWNEEVSEIVAIISEMQIGMTTELNITVATKSSDWLWYNYSYLRRDHCAKHMLKL